MIRGICGTDGRGACSRTPSGCARRGGGATHLGLKPQAVPLDRFAIGAAADDRRGDDPITALTWAAGGGGQMPNSMAMAVSPLTNQLSGAGYGYDVLGNLVQMPAGVDFVTMSYLDQGHIGTLTDAAGVVWKYYYDADGKRRIKVKTAGGAATEPDGQGGMRLVADRSFYFYEGEDLICQQDIGALVQDESQYEPKFLLLDHLGSTRAEMVFTESGGTFSPVIQEYYDLMPYGEVIDPPTTQESVLFTGKQRDTENELDYFGPRNYASGSFRWNSPDLMFLLTGNLTNPQGWNLYSYTYNNPIIFADPTGMIVQVANPDDQKKLDEYVNGLDKNSDASMTYDQLNQSSVVFNVNFLDSKRGTGEGSLTTQDGTTIDVNIVFAGPTDTMSLTGKLTHESEHGRQYLSGELGFVSDSGGAKGTWKAAFYDATDEKLAFDAQLKAAPQDRRADVIKNMDEGHGIVGLAKVATVYGMKKDRYGPINVPPNNLPKGRQTIASYQELSGVAIQSFQNRKYSIVPK